MRILLVEDEQHIARTLEFNFKAEGYETTVAADGEVALQRTGSEPYDLIVLDVMLPGIDGFEVARRIRADDSRVPILMLTALSSDEDRIAGLECGVDDYLVKPFVLRELMLRIAGLLRRAQWCAPAVDAPFRFGRATIDPNAMTAKTQGQERKLTRLEVDLIKFFAASPNRLVSRDELLVNVWGYEPDTATRTVDAFVLRVRKMIEPEPSRPIFLTSVRGEGYRYLPSGSSHEQGSGSGGSG